MTIARTTLAALMALAASTPTVAAQSSTPEAETAYAYCTNLADEAEDARYARQLASLAAAEARVEERIAALEDKRAEYEDWLQRRKEFLRLAEERLVAIYAGMRPDAASEQLAEMGELQAAAVIAKVPPRTASAILNEMDAPKAARIAAIMSGFARADDEPRGKVRS